MINPSRSLETPGFRANIAAHAYCTLLASHPPFVRDVVTLVDGIDALATDGESGDRLRVAARPALEATADQYHLIRDGHPILTSGTRWLWRIWRLWSTTGRILISPPGRTEHVPGAHLLAHEFRIDPSTESKGAYMARLESELASVKATALDIYDRRKDDLRGHGWPFDSRWKPQRLHRAAGFFFAHRIQGVTINDLSRRERAPGEPMDALAIRESPERRMVNRDIKDFINLVQPRGLAGD